MCAAHVNSVQDGVAVFDAAVSFLSPDPALRPGKAPFCRAMSAYLCLASLLLLGSGYASGKAVVAFDGAAAFGT